jgi:hypothetical protein
VVRALSRLFDLSGHRLSSLTVGGLAQFLSDVGTTAHTGHLDASDQR